MTHCEGLIYSKVKLQYLGVILYLHQLLCTHIERIILLVLPSHIQKLREKGQYRVAEIYLPNGSQPTGLVAAESQPPFAKLCILAWAVSASSGGAHYYNSPKGLRHSYGPVPLAPYPQGGGASTPLCPTKSPTGILQREIPYWNTKKFR